MKQTPLKRSTKPIRKRAKRKSLDKILDDLWSEAVKLEAGNKCEMCGEAKTLNSHHVYSRSRMSTRWDLQNGICLCAYHHTLGNESAHKSPMEFTEWIKDKRGVAWYESLKNKVLRLVKPTLEEKKEILQGLKDRIEELKDANG